MFIKNRVQSLVVCLSTVLVTITAMSVEAGPFRNRDRFNVKAEGFWMKGRCVTPGNLSASAFKDAGCIVKNRKGKRRPGKRRRNVDIGNLYFGFRDTGTGRRWATFYGPGATCRNARRCNSKRFADFSAEERGFKILGSINCIVGWGGDRSRATAFISRVGQVPGDMARDARRDIDRFVSNCR